jgi:Pectate lyase superfamily protein
MNKIAAIITLLGSLALLGAAAPSVHAQGSRKDDIDFGPAGHPVAGATIRVCQSTATGTPCSPLATIYTDATLATAAANPFQGDGIGNYHFYAPAGRYMVQITGPGISGAITNPDVILAPDVSSAFAGDDISAFSLALGGNLTVAGNATVNGTLTTTNFSPGSFTPSSLSVTGNESVQGPRPRIDVTAYGAKGDGTTDDTVAITNAINAACTHAGLSEPPTVYFPPGVYLVDQTQGSSTTPDLPSCILLHILGGGGSGGQFSAAPKAGIAVINGANPSAAPVFEPSSPASNMTFENIAIGGYNQSVWLNGVSGTHFRNVDMGVQTTGLADNTPLKITNNIWVWYQGGWLGVINGVSYNGNVPTVLMTGEGTTGSNVDVLIYFSDLILAGRGNPL